MDKKIDLAAAGLLDDSEPEAPLGANDSQAGTEELPEDDAVAKLFGVLDNLESSLASMHIAYQVLKTRVDQMTKYVSYLLEQDPYMKDKIAEHTAEMDAELSKTEPTTDDPDKNENA